MLDLSKHKNNIKIFLLTMIFTLLSCSIVDNAIEIYAVSSMEEKVCVPIIMYHQVKNGNLGKNTISPSEFESDLKYLANNGYNTITMSQLIDYVYDDVDLPPNPIILTFDDGYYSTYKYVFPLLKAYNMKIVLSIIGKSTDDFSRVNDHNVNYAHMTWDQISEVVESGLVEIQNHTYDMHKIRNGRYGCYQKANESLEEYEQLLSQDIYNLQDKVEMAIDKAPNTFTYPYGKFNKNTDLVLKKIGFKATLSVTYGVNLIGKDPEKLYDLKRICRSHNQSIGKLLKAAMDTLKYSNE